MENEKKTKEKYVLGIDMGTTSVKVTVISAASLCIVEEHSNSTDAYLVNNDEKSEQDVKQIISNLNHCMSSISENILEKIIGIGVSGQMHGLVCWSSDDRPWFKKNLERNFLFEIDSEKLSHHYTWQDNRCNNEFLSSLPKPNSHITVHTGYGICTLFWLIRNSPASIEKFNRAGTIADFVVTMLCDSENVLMSTQNAANWGYFNTETNEWNKDILKAAKFPIHLLPIVLQPNTVAGNLKNSWNHIPINTPVGIALGDLQCSVLAIMKNDDHAVVNISTSAQLVFIAKHFDAARAKKTVAKIVPYFNGKYMFEAAALNGGNAISLFISSFYEIFQQFGGNITKDDLWKMLIESSSGESSQSNLIFEPTFLGERHNPEQRGSITNITVNNFKISRIFRALCKGVIANLYSMVSTEILKKEDITKIIGTGSALLRNKTLQMELESQFSLPVEYKSSGDAPFGAALSMLKTLNVYTRKI